MEDEIKGDKERKRQIKKKNLPCRRRCHCGLRNLEITLGLAQISLANTQSRRETNDKKKQDNKSSQHANRRNALDTQN